MNNYYIYIYLDPRKSGKYYYNDICFLFEAFYIGKGKNKRYKRVDNRNPLFKNKINKIKKLGLEPVIIKLYENLNEKTSFEIEEKLIKEIGRIDLKTGPLVNMTDGGEGSSGYIFSDYSKNKISNSEKGKFVSQETKDKLSLSLTGRQLSEKTKEKMSISHKCIKFSDQHKNKIRKKLKGEGCKNNILISQDIIQIKFLLNNKKLIDQEIADIFGVKRTTISSIKTGKSWSHIKI